jgi:hypothetical protein
MRVTEGSGVSAIRRLDSGIQGSRKRTNCSSKNLRRHSLRTNREGVQDVSAHSTEVIGGSNHSAWPSKNVRTAMQVGPHTGPKNRRTKAFRSGVFCIGARELIATAREHAL